VAKEVQYYRLRIWVPCDNGGCQEEIYFAGENLKISRPELQRSITNFNSKKIQSELEDISEKEFEKGIKKTGSFKELP